MPPTAKPFIFFLAALLACLPLDRGQAARERQIVDATIADLIGRPWDFDGKWVRVSGYVIAFNGGVHLLEPRWELCYGGDEERRYLITDLPIAAVLGEGQGPLTAMRDLANDGRMATITGRFRARLNPWPRSPVVEPPDNPAAGPLRHARVERYGDTRCDAYIPPSR